MKSLHTRCLVRMLGGLFARKYGKIRPGLHAFGTLEIFG